MELKHIDTGVVLLAYYDSTSVTQIDTGGILLATDKEIPAMRDVLYQGEVFIREFNGTAKLQMFQAELFKYVSESVHPTKNASIVVFMG